VYLAFGAAVLARQQAPAQAPQPPAPSAPGFRLSASPETINVRRGSTGQVTVKVESEGGFKNQVALVASGLFETTMTFTPPIVQGGAGSTVLAISPAKAALKGTYLVSVTGIDGISRSISVRVTVK
jgi:hypothetical protein